jgi:hypothetical protein
MSHAQKIRESRSVSRHRPHSPKNYFGKVCSISSPLPVKKHKRRIGVDEI